MSDTAAYYTGTSNVVLPVANKGMFPPEFHDKSRLSYYASLLNSVEVNSTFYKIPLAKTVSRWCTEVPNGFKFTFKLWKGITHNKHLAFDEASLNRFMDVIAQAEAKAGCLLVQMPASITVANKPQLENLLACLSQHGAANAWKTAVEFRSKTWYTAGIYQLLDRYQAGMVMHDMAASATPMIDTAAGFVYLRFHGPEARYRGSYTDDFLSEYAEYIKQWLAEGKTVYVYFNNTMGNALQNLVTLNQFVAM